MFRSFFLSRRWFIWSGPGTALILFASWYKVELDVRINGWFGDFYNLVHKALGTPGSVAIEAYCGQFASFAKSAAVSVLVAVLFYSS